MTIVDYFQAIIYILMIITFIAVVLAFLHLLYGKEETTETKP